MELPCQVKIRLRLSKELIDRGDRSTRCYGAALSARIAGVENLVLLNLSGAPRKRK